MSLRRLSRPVAVIHHWPICETPGTSSMPPLTGSPSLSPALGPRAGRHGHVPGARHARQLGEPLGLEGPEQRMAGVGLAEREVTLGLLDSIEMGRHDNGGLAVVVARGIGAAPQGDHEAASFMD